MNLIFTKIFLMIMQVLFINIETFHPLLNRELTCGVDHCALAFALYAVIGSQSSNMANILSAIFIKSLKL